jgi:SPP1 family predicted phage head-tail adaptor
MLIGRMNKRIELQSYVKTSGIGAWTTQVTLWAEFKKPELKTVEVAANITSELIREISIRYRTDIKKGWRVLYGNKTFEVKHTYDYEKMATILVCSEVVV